MTTYLGRIGLVAAAYFGAAKLGLGLAFANSSVTAVWPPTGLALAAVVVWGARMWPGIALGAFLANVTTQGSFLTVCGITGGNTLEALAGAWLLARVDFRRDLSRIRDVVALVGLGALLSTIVSATIGVASLDADGLVRNGALWSTWRVWWLGDAGGDVLVASAILVLTSRPQLPRRRLAGVEAAGLAVGIVTVGVIVFNGRGLAAYAALPLLFWAAVRFGQPGAVGGGLLVAAIAVVFTKNGHGQFAGGTPDSALLRAQTFVGVATVTALLVAAVRSEQRASERAEESLREVIEASPDATLMVDDRGEIVMASFEAYRVFGARDEELVGTPISRLLPQGLRDRQNSTARRLNGSDFAVETRLRPIESDGRPMVIAAIRDVSDRKAAEEALRQAEQRFRAAFESAPVGMTLIGARPSNAGRYLAVNAAFAEMLGFSDPEELVGRHYTEFAYPDDLATLAADAPRLRADGYLRTERRYVTRGSRELWAELHVALIRGGDGEPDHIVTQSLDLTERRRGESELRQGAAIAGNLAEGVLMTRIDNGRVVYANTSAEELFGYRSGRLIGVEASVLVPDRERGLTGRGRRWSGELEHVRSDGSSFWCYVNVSEFEHPEHGRVLISAHADITDRRRAQAEAQGLAEIVESTAEAIIRSDADGTIVSWNRGAEQLFGYTAAEVLGRTGEFLVPAELMAERASFFDQVTASGSVVGVQTKRVRKDGRHVDVMLTVSPIRDEEGRFVGSSAIARDVTAERLQADALREAEERFRGAFDNAPIGMALVAPDGRWLRVNRAVCEIVGYPEEEMLNRSFQDITHPDDLDADLEYVRQMLAGEIRSYRMDKRYLHRDGGTVWITLSVSLVHDAAGEPLYFVSQIEDITERKRTERALAATAEIMHTVGGVTDLEPVLALIAERSRALVDARSLVIMLNDGNELTVAAAAGALNPTLVGSRVAADPSIAARVLASGRAERIDRVEDASVFALGTLGVSAASALVVPLGFRGVNLGVIEALDRGSGPEFGEEDERLLLAAAASAGIAVATAQSVARDQLRRTLRGAEDERRRWARELHDETLQGLGGLRMMLASGQRSPNEHVLRGVVHSALDQLDTEIESLRVLISELRPAALDELGLHAALLALGERTRVANGIDVTTAIEEAPGGAGATRLDPEVETVVYRVVQEALTNAARHANPDAVEVRLKHEDGAVSVTIADDGIGFDPTVPADGFGLVGMRERVSLVGGRFELTSSPDGTTVKIPLPQPAAAIARAGSTT